MWKGIWIQPSEWEEQPMWPYLGPGRLRGVLVGPSLAGPAGSDSGVGYSRGAMVWALALLSAENHRKGLGWTLVWEMEYEDGAQKGLC